MISFVVAYSNNRVIGKNNDLPWYLPDDLKRFKVLTAGHTVIMGRKTYESIFNRLGKPLPNRRNIVISKSLKQSPGIEVASSIETALNLAKSENEVFVLGGETVFSEALSKNFVDRIYATEIDADIDGDTYFPQLDMKKWKTSTPDKHTHKGLDFSFIMYDKIKK